MVLAPAHQIVTQRGSDEITVSVHAMCPNYTCNVVHELKWLFISRFIAMNQLETVLYWQLHTVNYCGI